MFHDVDATLRRLLVPPADAPVERWARRLSERYDTPPDVSFVPPDQDFRSSVQRPTINVFLYDVRENWDYRTHPFVEESDGTVGVRRHAPAMVDCSYVITVWGAASGESQTSEEHEVLGLVTSIFLEHRTIPPWARRGALESDSTARMVRGKIAPRESIQSLGEFWQSMGGAPRAVLQYALTIAVPVREDRDAGPLATGATVSVTPMPAGATAAEPDRSSRTRASAR